MSLTIEQLHEIRAIIEVHHQAFIVNTIGTDTLLAPVVQKLKDMGLLNVTVSSVEDAYLYGHAIAASEDPKVAKMSYEQFKEYVQKNPIPLGDIEKRAVAFAKQQAAQFVVGLGNKVNTQTGQLMIEADASLRAKTRGIIRDATAENIASRESVKKLKSNLGWATKDWARDWDRIAVTEKHTSMQRGTADHIAERHGPEALVAKRPTPGACPHCLRLHIGPDGHPRIFKLSTLEANGLNNFGRKAADWLPVIGSTHPNCFPPGTAVSTHRGNIPIETVQPGDLVRTAAGDLRPITHTWASIYEGDLVTMRTASSKVTATPNHPFLLRGQWTSAERLVEGDNLQRFEIEGGAILVVHTNSMDSPPVRLQDRRFAKILFGFSRTGVPVTAIDLAGEFYIREGQIDKEAVNLISGGRVESGLHEGIVDPTFIGRFDFTRLRSNTGKYEVVGFRFTPDGAVESGEVKSPLFWRKLTHADSLSLGSVPGDSASSPNSPYDCTATHIELSRYFFHREQLVEMHCENTEWFELAPKRSSLHDGAVSIADPIVNVSRVPYRGLVYNLTVAEEHTFTANGFVVHNCQCQLVRIPAGWGFDEGGSLVPGGEFGQSYEDEVELAKAMVKEFDLQKAYALEGKVEFQGMVIAIENKIGSKRHWRDENGDPGETTMLHAYGYVEGTEGADGDEIDVYVGPDPRAQYAYVIHQQNPKNGTYDEDKVMLGFTSEYQARMAYHRHYDSPDFYVTCSPMKIEHFKRWIRHTAPNEGELMKAGTLAQPHTIPLTKAQVNQLAAVDSRAAHHNPGPGTIVNYMANVEPRPAPTVGKEIREAYDTFVVSKKFSEQKVVRDQEDMKFDSPADRRDYRYDLPEIQMDRPDKDEVKANREHLDKQAKPKGLPNHAEIEEEEEEEEPIEKGKYVTPIGGITPKGYKKTGPHTYEKVETKPAHIVSGTNERQGHMQLAKSSEMTPPNVHDKFMQRGHDVIVKKPGKPESKGKLMGYNHEGRPVVKFKGKQRTLHWEDVEAAKPQPYKPVYAHLTTANALVHASPRQKELVNDVLKLQVAKGKSAKTYMDWLRVRGNEVFLVGGIVRDLISGTSPESSQTDSQVKEAMQDIDIVSTAHPQIGIDMGKAVGGTILKDNSKWGVSQILDGVGLDVSSIASSSGDSFKKGRGIYDHDLEDDIQRRDFTANTLFYDVYNEVIVDPTGHGIADAQAKVLRLAPTEANAKRNSSLPIRFWKFRARGWKTEDKTLDFMKKQLPKMDEDYIQSELVKIMLKGGDPKTNWRRFRDAMRADGAHHLYVKYIRPHKKGVLG